MRDTTVLRFNPPAEPARTVKFRQRDLARTVRFGNQATSAREIPEEPGSEHTRGLWVRGWLGVPLVFSAAEPARTVGRILRQNRPGRMDGVPPCCPPPPPGAGPPRACVRACVRAWEPNVEVLKPKSWERNAATLIALRYVKTRRQQQKKN
jgi:hypothetical protein